MKIKVVIRLFIQEITVCLRRTPSQPARDGTIHFAHLAHLDGGGFTRKTVSWRKHHVEAASMTRGAIATGFLAAPEFRLPPALRFFAFFASDYLDQMPGSLRGVHSASDSHQVLGRSAQGQSA